MGTRLAARVSRLRPGIAIAAGLVAVSGPAAYSGMAGAAPKPDVSQVRQQVSKLTSQFDLAGQQLDQVAHQLSAAHLKLAAVRAEAARDQARFQSMQRKVAQIAAASYENSGMTSVADPANPA